ncbi:uncharacterized protein [Miscanthus floridulus]|uniref:uncharacterized protein n=1 Tax=Miscanthus floridulus TaxID=154761 RepID=UPI00345988A4
MTNNTIPHDHHHHRLRPHHQEMDQLQALAVKPQVKRQARRRRHTSRPYQERLLNMAEARREIVTALKIHRASSTRHQQQSTYQHHHHEPPPHQPPLQQLQQEQQEEEQQQVQVQVAFHDRSQAAVDEEATLAHTTMSYAAASFANNPLCNSPPAHWIAAGSYCSPPPILRLPCDLTPPELPLPTASMGGLVELEHYQYQGGLERLVRSLPAQPLGLNLSFQGFGVSVDDGAKDDCEDLLGLPLTQPSPAASYSYSPPAIETATTHACGHGSPSPALTAAAFVPVLLDGGEMMAQQTSTGGEMQGVECSEAAAADVAAWWSKIFESGQRAPPNAEDVAAATAAGLPADWRWLCGDDDVGAAEQGAVTGGVPATMMHVDDGDYYSCCYEGDRSRSDDGEDVTLPCMDGIGDEVQGWDGEWFSCS